MIVRHLKHWWVDTIFRVWTLNVMNVVSVTKLWDYLIWCNLLLLGCGFEIIRIKNILSHEIIVIVADEMVNYSLVPPGFFIFIFFSSSNQKPIYLLGIKKNIRLKEYSVILTISFHSMNQKIPTKKAYFQNFSWFQFCIFKSCMIMCVSLLP